jgi:DNA-binding protein HU-beta
MNKTDLIKNITAKTEITKKDVETVVEGFLAEVTEGLQNGDKVSLVGFGNFETRKRAARKGRNPQTGAEIDIPETRVPAFKPGKGLREAVK